MGFPCTVVQRERNKTKRGLFTAIRAAIDVVSPSRHEFDIQGVGEAEKNAFLEMVRNMLPYTPAERSAASEVLTCEWMQHWARPEISQTKKRTRNQCFTSCIRDVSWHPDLRLGHMSASV